MKFILRSNKKFLFLKILLQLLDIPNIFIPIVFIKPILDEIAVGRNIRTLYLYILYFALANGAVYICRSILNYFYQKNSELASIELNYNFNKLMMEMRYDEVESPAIRDFMSKAQGSVNFNDIMDIFISFVKNIITCCGLIAIISTISPVIFMIVIIPIIMRILSNRILFKRWEDTWNPMFRKLLRKITYFNSVSQLKDMGKEIRINNLHQWVGQKDTNIRDEYIEHSRVRANEYVHYSLPIDFFEALQVFVVYLMLSYKMFSIDMTIGDYAMYLTAIISFSNGIGSIVENVSNLLGQGLIVREFRYCVESAQRSGYGGKIQDDVHIDTENIIIEYRDVSFKYPNTDRMILKNINIVIRKDETLSIVGLNGAGKTTFVKLLCCLYRPTHGTILLNGIDIQNIPFKQYARLIGVVFQDFKLFAYRVNENITAKENPGEDYNEKIHECLKKVGLADKVFGLKNGLETFIGKELYNGGIEFSGGESQKIAIAKVLYKDPPIIVLDEPTSALDPLIESEIYENFNNLTNNKCAVYISHRMSSTRFTNKVAVFKDGTIVEYGNHKELYQISDGEYRKLFDMQARYYV
jgi:ATP-binding cassette subfamily B protein/ATP-binding cassette subfamily C protein